MSTQTDEQYLSGVKQEYQYGFHDNVEAVFKLSFFTTLCSVPHGMLTKNDVSIFYM